MVTVPRSPLGRILARHAAHGVRQALTDTRVVLVNGARQCGKSTMVAQIAQERSTQWFSLDRADTLQAARRDPGGFVRSANPMVIDEIQRCPDLLLAIKEVVDGDFQPGRFLLTGSARILGLKKLPDTLPGRMETIELWPLSQGEIDGCPNVFVDAVFNEGPALACPPGPDRQEYVARLVRGGFAEAVARSGRRRTRLLESYVADLVNRDIMQMSSVKYGNQMRRLLTLLAGRAGQILNTSNIASTIGLPRQTVERYLAILEEVYLIKRIPAWSHGATARATRAPKLAFVDSGVAAMLRGQDESTFGRITADISGLLESFVAMEIARQTTWANHSVGLSHYRTRDQVEVDLVLESRQGQVVGIEVKSSSTASDQDFSGLRHLQARLGEAFLAGFVLYLGEQCLPFGPGLRALPLSALWECS